MLSDLEKRSPIRRPSEAIFDLCSDNRDLRGFDLIERQTVAAVPAAETRRDFKSLLMSVVSLGSRPKTLDSL